MKNRMKQSFIPIWDFRPFYFLNEHNEIVKAPIKVLSDNIDNEFIEKYRAAFKLRDPKKLKNYSIFLKAEIEVWKTWDSGLYQILQAILMALISAGIASLVTTTKMVQNETWIEIIASAVTFALGGFILAFLALLFLPIQIRKIATKKAKAIVFINLIDEVINEQKR